jgi:hypothetical protein
MVKRAAPQDPPAAGPANADRTGRSQSDRHRDDAEKRVIQGEPRSPLIAMKSFHEHNLDRHAAAIHREHSPHWNDRPQGLAAGRFHRRRSDEP